jgi:hypothetical protein
MDFTQFGWRDGVLLIAVGIGVYVAIMLLRLLQLGKQKGGHDLPNHAPSLFASADPVAPAAAAGESVAAAEYELPFHFPPPQFSAGAAEDLAAPAGVPRPIPPEPSFAETLESSRLEQEVRQLRAEVAALREELLDLQAAHRVAPQYADAMALARRGFDARGIADHCGIALGEAELVMALARGADDPQAENDYAGFESGQRRAAG